MKLSNVSNLSDALRGSPLFWLHDRGLTDATIKRYYLGWDARRKAIVIPYLNALGEVRRLRYRNFDSEPKYIWDKAGEPGVHLFHVRATRKEKLWLTEGEFDAMILSQMGFPAISIPGAKLFKNEWRYLFAYCRQLTVVFDGDQAGLEGTQRVAGILGPIVDNFRSVRLPQDMDVSDLYKQDRSKLEELVK